MELFKQFLYKHKVNKGEPYTHTSLKPIAGSYNFSDDDLDKLYTEYKKLFLCQNRVMHMTEKPLDESPLRCDFDFSYEITSANRVYTEDDLLKIVKIHNDVINDYVKNPKLECIVLEKPKPRIHNASCKDGVHLFYPHIVTDKKIQYAIRNDCIEKFKEINLLGDMSKQPLNTLDDIYDKAVILRNNWCLYGSTAKLHSNYVYKVSYIYDEELDNIYKGESDKYYTQEKLFHLMSVRDVKSSCKIKKSMIKHADDLFKTVKQSKKKDKKQKKKMIKKDINLDYVNKLVDILSVDRANNYMDWIDLGMCLFNINSEKLLDTWVDFSKKTTNPRYKQSNITRECKRMWKSFREESWSIGSLIFWAKEDNPKMFYKLFRESIQGCLVAATSGTCYDVAKLLFELNQFNYRCASLDHNTWYEFKNNKWNEMQKAHSLITKIPTELVEKFEELASFYTLKLGEAKTEDNQLKWKTKLKNVMIVINKCKDDTFQNKVISQAKHLFFDPEFENRLDSNPFLLGCENGVYDLKNHQFRNGRPDDYLSMSTRCKFKKYDRNSENAKAIFDFFLKIQPIDHIREYVLTVLASCLDGHNAYERFYIGTGSGSNGKSKMVELMKEAIGDYAANLPISLLTQNRSASNAASPELARLKGTRFVTLQEPKEDAKMNTGLLKELSGGDMIYARPLYKSPVEFKPQFQLLLLCNQKPTISSNDGGTWRRIRVLDFLTKFCGKPKAPNEIKGDPMISEKIKEWGSDFLGILVEYYKIYSKRGIDEPREVMRSTTSYKEVNDVYGLFIKDHIVEDSKSKMKLRDIFYKFKTWFAEGNMGRKCPRQQDLKIYLEKKYGNMKIFGWRLRFKTSASDESDESDDEDNE